MNDIINLINPFCIFSLQFIDKLQLKYDIFRFFPFAIMSEIYYSWCRYLRSKESIGTSKLKKNWS